MGTAAMLLRHVTELKVPQTLPLLLSVSCTTACLVLTAYTVWPAQFWLATHFKVCQHVIPTEDMFTTSYVRFVFRQLAIPCPLHLNLVTHTVPVC